ncbi:hypothetical protein [Ottowia sp.]|uniref:hypothetical protein n=1 Tax=Ottowia sp. TaxID=1898956 RepID=UPI002628C9C8|nr:hypothetical protein [Ottowia sp.]
MWFINGARQVFELSTATHEKRARPLETRPQPTIYGNCESWNPIVGKKGRPKRQKIWFTPSLHLGNVILSTSYQQILCGFFEHSRIFTWNAEEISSCKII